MLAPLLAADHVRILHPPERRGFASIARSRERWVETAVSIAELPEFASRMQGEADVFISQQSFWGWRRIVQLAQLGAVYSDLDYRTTRWLGQSPETVAYEVLSSLDGGGLPAPSYILATGRGLLAVWLHDFVPRDALPRWIAIQQHLCDFLRPFGADPRALDAARVFRLAGTVHGRVNVCVRPVWMVTPASQMWRWDFEDLAREVLPVQRMELETLSRTRATNIASKTAAHPCSRLSAATYHEAVLADLQRLRHYRWFGSLPAGHRDTWLFLACNSVAWLAPPAVLEREFRALAREVAGWDHRECDSRMASVLRRAGVAARGHKIEWRGQQVDPRYKIRVSTIIEWLDVSRAEMRGAGLRVLVDADVARERAVERKQASRRRAGVKERAEYTAQAETRRSAIQLLRDRGLTWRAIAAELNISLSEAYRLGRVEDTCSGCVTVYGGVA